MAQDNPILDMGLLNMMQPNKYISPQFAGKPLQLPGFYTGQAGGQPPTDAQGNPIQSFVNANNTAQADYQKQLANQPAQGTTLNSTPGQSGVQSSLLQTPAMQQMMSGIAAAQANKSPQQLGVEAQNDAMRQQMLQRQANISDVQAAGGGFGNMPGGAFNSGSYMPQQLPSAPTSSPAASTGGGPPSPPNLRQAYLDALANPGKVTTPGATVAPSNPLGQPSVLNSFLANNPGGQVGNQGFFSTLNKLRSA